MNCGCAGSSVGKTCHKLEPHLRKYKEAFLILSLESKQKTDLRPFPYTVIIIHGGRTLHCFLLKGGRN